MSIPWYCTTLLDNLWFSSHRNILPLVTDFSAKESDLRSVSFDIYYDGYEKQTATVAILKQQPVFSAGSPYYKAFVNFAFFCIIPYQNFLYFVAICRIQRNYCALCAIFVQSICIIILRQRGTVLLPIPK